MLTRRAAVLSAVGVLLLCPPLVCAQTPTNKPPASPSATAPALLVEMKGKVDVMHVGTTTWTAGVSNQVLQPGDRVRTSERSRAVVRLSDLSMVRLDEHYILPIPSPPAKERSDSGFLKSLKGLLYFLHRDKPGTFPAQTPSAYAVIVGTEFTLAIDENGATTLHLVDGQVLMTNAFGRLELHSGESARAEVGKAPERIPAPGSATAIQWCLYYPGIIDPLELNLPPAGGQVLTESLAAYRSGDIPAALARYPAGRTPDSDAEKVYLAALLLSVGQVTNAVALLDAIPANTPTRVGSPGTELEFAL